MFDLALVGCVMFTMGVLMDVCFNVMESGWRRAFRRGLTYGQIISWAGMIVGVTAAMAFVPVRWMDRCFFAGMFVAVAIMLFHLFRARSFFSSSEFFRFVTLRAGRPATAKAISLTLLGCAAAVIIYNSLSFTGDHFIAQLSIGIYVMIFCAYCMVSPKNPHKIAT